MTVVVGLEHDGKVYLGADSAGVGGYDLVVRADAKVFINKGVGFGFTSSFRMGQLLRYQLKIPQQKRGQDDFGYLVTTFMDAVRGCLKKGGFAAEKSKVESGGNFLVAYRGKLYEVDSDYQVGRPHPIGTPGEVFASCGCGHLQAKGALFASGSSLLHGNAIDPRFRVIQAMEAAEQFSAGVRGPFEVVVA